MSREGPNTKRGGSLLARGADEDRSQPTLWAFAGTEAVQRPESGEERSPSPAREPDTPYPVRAEHLWEEVFSQTNVARAAQGRAKRRGTW